MTQAALTLLAMDPRPFILIIEGGQIDWGGHSHDISYMITETIAFDHAVQTARSFTQSHNDTLLIVTADHDTGGLTLTGPSTFSVPLPDPTAPHATYWAALQTRALDLNITWTQAGHSNASIYTYLFPPLDYSPTSITDHTNLFTLITAFTHLNTTTPPVIDYSTTRHQATSPTFIIAHVPQTLHHQPYLTPHASPSLGKREG